MLKLIITRPFLGGRAFKAKNKVVIFFPLYKKYISTDLDKISFFLDL